MTKHINYELTQSEAQQFDEYKQTHKHFKVGVWMADMLKDLFLDKYQKE